MHVTVIGVGHVGLVTAAALASDGHDVIGYEGDTGKIEAREPTTAGTDALRHLTEVVVDERPWGRFRQYTHNRPTTVKLITVEAGQQLSLQRHAHRDELWVVLDAGLTVEVGGEVTEAVEGAEFFIPRGTVHRVGGGTSGGRFLEIAFGDFDEDDIERLEDRYGRG
jgi:mannose-6-phosphate isomerase